MKTILGLAAFQLILTASPSTAGEATSEQTFDIEKPFITSEILDWYETRRVGILKAANCEITKPLKKSHYRVKSKTPLGNWNYIVRETIHRDQTRVRIEYTLADKLRTNLVNNVVTITILRAESGCSVTMKMVQKVNSRLAPSSAIRRSQHRSIEQVKEYLTSQVRPAQLPSSQ